MLLSTAFNMFAFTPSTPVLRPGTRADRVLLAPIPKSAGVLEAATRWRQRITSRAAPELAGDMKPKKLIMDNTKTVGTVTLSASSSTTDVSAEKRPPKWLLDVNHFLVGSAVTAVNAMYDGAKQPFHRLWVLEVVARVPYFSFLCILHLAESLGLGSERISDLQRRHFDENENEAIHLAIMDTLGGGSRFQDRFIAQHAAIVYYVGTCVAYVISPSLAYHFSTLVEQHAYETYDALLKNQEVFLKEVAPVPLIARKYYTERAMDPRDVRSMWDVIEAIRDDEAQHSEDLQFYSDESFGNVPWRFPNSMSSEN